MSRLTREEALTLVPGDKLKVESIGRASILQVGETVTFIKIANCECCCLVRRDSGSTSARYFRRFSRGPWDWWDVWGVQ